MKISILISIKLLASVLLLALFFLSIIQTVEAQTTGTFTDPRDRETYTTITIEDPLAGIKVTWMSQNLRYRIANSWAYDNQERYEKKLGRLYTWQAAIGACPAGWRLPSDADWSALINKFGGNRYASSALKGTKGWNNNGNGTNISGFSALPGGHRDLNGIFQKIGDEGFWWSATEDGSNTAWSRLLFYGDGVGRRNLLKNTAISVRCLRD